MGNNQVVQKIVIDAKDARDQIKKVNEDLKSATTDMSRSLTESSKSFDQNEQQVKRWGTSFKQQMQDSRKEFMDNLATGAKALTLDAAAHALHKSAGDAIEMAAEASKTFADMQSRIGASDDQIVKWQRSLGQAAISTKANLASMEKAFSDLSDSADPDQIMKFMDTVGGATVMTRGNSKSVTDYLKTTTLGQGKDLNQDSVNAAMGGADMLRRKGVGFGSLESAMSAMGGMDQTAIQNSHLDPRHLAAIIAGASHAHMGAGQAVSGVSALLNANKNGIMQGSVLSGLLGVSGKNGLSDAKGNFDISKLGQAGVYDRLMGMGGGDRNKAMEVFGANSGVGPEASEAIFKMIENFKALNATLKDAEQDTTTFAQSAKISGKNLIDDYQQMQNKLVVGFRDIMRPGMGIVDKVMTGDLKGAAGGLPGAIGGTLEGIGHHPLLAGGALLATAGGGMLLKSLLGRIPGIGGLAKGAVGGAIAKQMGAEPVYVVNASDIGGGDAEAITKSMSPLVTILRSVGGSLLGVGGAVVGGAAIGYVAGTAINDQLDAHADTNKYGQKFNLAEKGIAKLMPQWAGGMNHQQYLDNYTAVKVKVEVDSKDPQFSAKPKATDNTRDGRTH